MQPDIPQPGIPSATEDPVITDAKKLLTYWASNLKEPKRDF